MASPFNTSNPPDTESVKLGAERIRTLKSVLNNTLGRLFTLSTSDSPSATVSEVANSISGTMLQNDASVDGNRAVNTNHIKDSAVTAAKIASDAVTTVKILDANVTTAKIADSNVTTAKIADSNVTTDKIADDAVTDIKLADLSIGSEHYIRPKKFIRYEATTIDAGLSRNGSGTVTATLAGHGLSVGDKILVTGDGSGTTFDGAFTVASVVSTSQFTYAQAGAADSSNSGTVLLRPVGFSYSPSSSSFTSVSASRASTTVTVTWVTHGLATNDCVRISAGASSAFTGEWQVTVVDVNTFTFTTATSGTIGATTVKAVKLTRDISVTSITDGTPDAYVLAFTVAFPDSRFGALASISTGSGASTNDAAVITALSTTGATVEIDDTASGNDKVGFTFYAFA